VDPDAWSEESIFWSIVALLLAALMSFVAMDVGVGEPKVVSGIVTSIGVDSGTMSELPVLIITVGLESGRIAQLKINRRSLVKKGNKVLLTESEKFISPGYEYKLLQVLE